MQRRDAGEIELIAPTWVTLYTIRGFATVADALDGAWTVAVPAATRPASATASTDPISLWHGDAGYATGDTSVPGPRHRLEMTPGGYLFDESGYSDPGD